MNFEWLIIGGGIQGSTLASFLLQSNRTTISNIGIVDPHPTPLNTWKRCTKTIEMPFLRSPSVHHLALDPFGLDKYAKLPANRGFAQFTEPYDRPSLALFNKHCQDLFREINLQQAWIQDRAIRVKKHRQNWQVSLASGQELHSHKVVLALGLSEQPFWPEWAKEIRNQGGNIHHIFEPTMTQAIDSMSLKSPSSIAIIGGGISAAHTAIKFSKLYPGKVTLLTRHPIRVHQFDSDPGWLGPKNMSAFSKNKNIASRRQIIIEARHRGSMPKDLRFALLKAEREGALKIIEAEVLSSIQQKDFITLSLTRDDQLVVDHVILATGFKTNAPGMDWLQSTIKEEELICSSCGYPIANPKTLEWTPNLYVLGALAELEIGPVSRNIAGARRGAERIISSVI